MILEALFDPFNFLAIAIPAAAANYHHSYLEKRDGQALYLLEFASGRPIGFGPAWIRPLGTGLFIAALVNTLGPLGLATYFAFVGNFPLFVACLAYYGASLVSDLASNHVGPWLITSKVSPASETFWAYGALGSMIMAWSFAHAPLVGSLGLASFFLTWPLMVLLKGKV